MTLSTHKTAAKQAGGAEDIDGGVFLHAGTIASSRWTNKSHIDLGKARESYGATVTDSAWVDAVVSGQPLPYNPNGRAYSRTKANSGFLIRGVQTLIGNKSATADILNIVGSHHPGARKSIHSRESYYGYGLWSDTRFDLLRGVFTDIDGNAKSTISGLGTSRSHINPLTAGGATASADSAARPTRAIPGEFVILATFVDWTTGSASGDGSGAVNLMDYSAITG